MKKFLLIVFSLISLQSQNIFSQNNEIDFQIDKFRDLLNIIKDNYKDSVNLKSVAESGFKAMLNSLDPQSIYFNYSEYKALKESNTAQVTGIGLVPVIIFNRAVVYSVVKGSAADSANIEAMDDILQKDNDLLLAKNEKDLNDLLNGTIGSKVKLKIRKHKTGQIQEMELSRNNIDLSSITTDFKYSDDIAYIKINHFSSRCDVDFIGSLNNFSKKELKCLIVDLRDNSGGYLDQVANLISNFISKNDFILKSKSSNKNFNVEKKSIIDGKYQNLPIIVLVNENSASASEIFSGCVQDYDMGLVVGERTFGKGSVQNTWEFKDSSGFRITVAEYLTPSGREIQKNIKTENKFNDLKTKLNLGDSLYSKIQKSINEFGGLKNLPIFKSKKGRPIIAGGGVFPDYIVRNDTISLLFQVMKNQRIIIEYAFKFIDSNYLNISKFKNYHEFNKNFNISEEMMKDLKNLSVSKNVWNQEMFDKDKDKIANNLKCIIAEYFWKINGFYYVSLSQDIQFQKALSLVDEAVKIKNSK